MIAHTGLAQIQLVVLRPKPSLQLLASLVVIEAPLQDLYSTVGFRYLYDLDQLFLLADEYPHQVLVKLITVDEAHSESGLERQATDERVVIDGTLLVEQA